MPPNNDQDHNVSTCLLDLTNKIEQLITSHQELADNITKLKEAIYHPDEGIYSRIRELERDVLKDGEVRMAKVERSSQYCLKYFLHKKLDNCNQILYIYRVSCREQ